MQAAKKALHARMSALLDDIRENPFTLRLILQPFTPEHTQAFLNATLDGVSVSPEVAQNLWEKTGGLPLYIEQVQSQCPACCTVCHVCSNAWKDEVYA